MNITKPINDGNFTGESDEIQDWMNAPFGKPKAKTQTDEIGQVDTFVSRLKASMAAIHFHSGKFSVRNWRLVPKHHLVAILKSIHDECEGVLPELKKLSG